MTNVTVKERDTPSNIEVRRGDYVQRKANGNIYFAVSAQSDESGPHLNLVKLKDGVRKNIYPVKPPIMLNSRNWERLTYVEVSVE